MDVNNLTNVYNQNPTLQSSYTLPQYLDLFGQSPTTGTPPPVQITPTDPNAPNAPVDGIINSNINQYQNQGGGQDNRGTRTYTSLQDRAPSINRNDRSFIDPLNEKIANQMRSQNRNLESRTNAEIISSNPDMFDIKTNKGFIGNTVDNMKTMGGNIVESFSGLPGVDQTKGFFKNVMDNTMIGRVAAMRDATNPNAANYNPNLIDQKDYALRGVDQGGLGYTQDDIGRFTGQAVDPFKANYNPLAGLSLQSGFGSNDLDTMYNKQLDRLLGYQKKKFSEKRQTKIDAINKLIADQKQAAIDKFEAEKKAAGIAAMAAQNKANNTGGYQAGYGSDFMDGPSETIGGQNQGLGGQQGNAGGTATMGSSRDGGLMGYGGKSGTPRYKNGGATNGSGEKALSAKVKELMDDGYEFGEAVKEAMKQGYMNGGRIKSYFKGGLVSLRGK